MRIGRHTSKSGSYERAVLRIHELGGNTLQIFSSSPRIWKSSTPDPDDIRSMHLVREKHDIIPLVVHDSYLINLASNDDKIRSASVSAFRREIERCIFIGAEYLVAHPGNYKDQSLEEGLLAVVEGLVEASAQLSSHRLTVLLENTVGAGNQLGSRFEELEVIRRLAQERMDIGVGFCLDTRATKARSSIVTRTSEREKLGIDAFSRMLNHPKLHDKAFILETPAETPADEQKDIDTLKRLYKPVKGRKRSA